MSAIGFSTGFCRNGRVGGGDCVPDSCGRATVMDRRHSDAFRNIKDPQQSYVN